MLFWVWRDLLSRHETVELRHREQEAIKHAESALMSADATPGTRRTTTSDQIEEDTETLNRRAYSVLWAYQNLISSAVPTPEAAAGD